MQKQFKPNPEIHTKVASFLQRIQRAVDNGYYHFKVFNLHLNDVRSFAKKCEDYYFTNTSPVQKTRRKKEGDANALLYFLRRNTDHTDVIAVLLCTDSKNKTRAHPAIASEKMGDTRNHTMTILKNFEMVRFVKPAPRSYKNTRKPVKNTLPTALQESLKANPKKNYVWTWRLPTNTVNMHVQHISKCIKDRNEQAIKIGIAKFFAFPGFAQIRHQQKKQMPVLWASLVKNGYDPVKYLPETVFYLRQIPNYTITLNDLYKSLDH